MTRLVPLDEAQAACVRSFRAGYTIGLEAGRASLEDDLNYWYWRAVAPEEHAKRMQAILAHADVQANRTATAQRWAALDKAEKDRQAELDAAERAGQAVNHGA